MKDERGMTLIELLATIAIFSLIVGVSYSLFSFVQANFTITNTYVSSETDVQELEMALTREAAAPTSLTKTNDGIRFTVQDETIRSITTDGNGIKLYAFDPDGSNRQLVHDFDFPINQIQLLDATKNPVPVGTRLSEGMAYFRFTYTTKGLTTKQQQLTIPIDIFNP